MSKLTKLTTLFFIIAAHSATAGQLYQWYGKDGTPTYSPDPPPKGVTFVIVGDDLEPLKQQPAAALESKSDSETATASTPKMTNQASSADTKPSKWKPVRYANDPALGKAASPELKTKTVVQSGIGAPLSYESKECLELKQKKLIVESQFARAATDAEMDQAILKLSEHQSAYSKKCKN